MGRDETRLNKLAELLRDEYRTSVLAISKDLSQPNSAKELYETIRNADIDIDVLINNAGIGRCGLFSEIDDCTNIDMIQLNISTLTQLTNYFMKHMLERKRGHILNVASTGAYQPGPYIAVYYATKAYVLSFTEAIAYELKDSGIVVSALCPGATATNFAKRAGKNDAKGAMTPEDVAMIAYKGMMKGKRVIVPGIANKIGIIFSKFMPRIVSAHIIGKAQYRLISGFNNK